MTMSDDPELETFLRRFQPSPPRPLPRRPRLPMWRWLAAAAALVVAAGLWSAGERTAPPAPPAPPAPSDPELELTASAWAAAVRDGSYEEAVDRLGGSTLPDPEREGGAFRFLAAVDPGETGFLGGAR